MSAEGLSRRNFLKVGAATVAVGALAPGMLLGDEDAPGLEFRTLGRTGLKVTTVSLGCMVAPEQVIAKGCDMGINWFDTAHGYKGGQNEGEVARALGDRRKTVHICTKIRGGSRDALLKQLETSLSRLKTDYVDMVLIHSVKKRNQVMNEEFMAAVEKAKKEGKARFVGVSSHGGMAECVQAAVDAKIYDAVLVKYNYATKNPGLSSAIAAAGKAGVGIIAMKTQLGNFPNPQGGMTPHQAALKWVLDNENVACAVPGMRSFSQLEQNFAVMGKRLAYRDRRKLERYQEATAALHCAECGVCTGACPKGVDIHEVRRCAMYLDGYRDPTLAKENYRAIRANAAPCTDCATCTVRCGNGTPLQPLLSRTHRRLAIA